MAEFRIKIAGQTALVRSLFDSTRDYCARYLTEETEDVFIAVTREDLSFEQEALRAEAIEEGIRIRRFTDPFLERAAIQRKLAEHLLHCDTLMVHGSTVAVDGQAYLFTAKCGTGKSTHTGLWRAAFGDRAVMVNDDKPFLRITEDGVLACGAPWSGKHGLDTNITVPLKGICILHRGGENRIRPITAAEAMPMLQKQSVPPRDPKALGRYRALVAALSRQCSLWEMACTKEAEAALVSYRAMSGRNEGGSCIENV